jgi:predicted RNA-binding protein (virulence factor B family)
MNVEGDIMILTQVGDYNYLEVLRETDFAYMLGRPEKEIFLHKKQATRELEIGEKIEVFLYYDGQKRVTATMQKPLIDFDTAAWLEVADVNHRLGVFLDWGLPKDLLLSRDDLPFTRDEWPAKGDKIFVKLRASRNQLTAKIITRYQIPEYIVPTEGLEVGQKYPVTNVYRLEEGNVFFTDEGHNIFVYFKNMRKDYRLGEQTVVNVTLDKGNYKYIGTLTEQKELMMSVDAVFIKEYLQKNNNEMPYTDKTNAETIQEVFKMSKSAFKRALGSLYKAKLVKLEKDKTTLLEEVE